MNKFKELKAGFEGLKPTEITELIVRMAIQVWTQVALVAFFMVGAQTVYGALFGAIIRDNIVDFIWGFVMMLLTFIALCEMHYQAFPDKDEEKKDEQI